MRDRLFTAASAISWIAELGHSRAALQSGGAAEFALVTAARARAIKGGICEAILRRQSERCSGRANGRAERATQTIRKQ
eukprot:1982162-Pyramimonas_sp.AAC.1